MKRNPSAPSHVTRAQAQRILGISKVSVYILGCKGGPLETELHFGTPMVPMWRVLAHQEQIGKEVKL